MTYLTHVMPRLTAYDEKLAKNLCALNEL